MPWRTRDTMSLRTEFIDQATLEGANLRGICRRFGISPTTGYKWLQRFRERGREGLGDQSRRPHHSPNRVQSSVEAKVIAVRNEHPTWGARKLRRRLQDLGNKDLPALSTITNILRRYQLLSVERPQRDLQRFESAAPNELWQMDFKGHFETEEGPCHPFTCIDDHSRYCLCIKACHHEDRETVQPLLEELFRIYGLPRAILCDNGNPWGRTNDSCPVTSLGVWLWRLGIELIHGRPYHPQTQGKLERFHRTLKADVLNRPQWDSHLQCQNAFATWRPIYNHQRPHEAIGDATPATRYAMSSRQYPDKLAPIEYDDGVITRRVTKSGAMSFRNRFCYVGRAFVGYRIGILRTENANIYEVRFGWKAIGKIDLTKEPAGSTRTISIWEKPGRLRRVIKKAERSSK